MNSSRALIPLLVVAGIWNCSNPTGAPSIRGGGLPVAGASTSGGAMAQNSGGANSGGSPMGMGGKLGVGGSGTGGVGGAAMGGNLGMGGASGGVGGTGLGGTSTGGTSTGGAAMGGTSTGGSSTGGAAMGGSSTGGVTGTIALNSGLIGYWKLDEASTAGMVMDSSGMNNHGTYSNPTPTRSAAVPTALAGPGAACLTFNGTNNQVILPAVSAYATWTAATSYSISVWVSVATFKGWVGIVANESGPSYCGLYVSDASKFAYEANETTAGSVAASTQMNVWHHVVIVQDASNNLQRLYVDGVASANARQAQDCSNTSLSPFRLGSPDGVDGYFSGSIDDVRFYNRALNQAEINALASGQQ